MAKQTGGGNHRNHYRALQQKCDQNTLSVSVVTPNGKIEMNLSKQITRRDIPELQRVLDEIKFRCTPHHTDTLTQTERRWMLLKPFLAEIRGRRVKYRGGDWQLSYAINRLLGHDVVMHLVEMLDELEARISNAANEALEFDRDELNHLRELKESASARAAEAAIRKLLEGKK